MVPESVKNLDFILLCWQVVDRYRDRLIDSDQETMRRCLGPIAHEVCKWLLASELGRPIRLTISDPHNPEARGVGVPDNTLDIRLTPKVIEDWDSNGNFEWPDARMKVIRALQTGVIPTNGEFWFTLTVLVLKGTSEILFGPLDQQNESHRDLARRALQLRSNPEPLLHGFLDDVREPSAMIWQNELATPGHSRFGDDLRKRLADRIRQAESVTRACLLSLQETVYVEDCNQTINLLRNGFGPDVDTEAFATRREFESYLNKRLATCDAFEGQDHIQLLQLGDALVCSSDAVIVYPRSRLAKYLADVMLKIIRKIGNVDGFIPPDLMYSTLYALPHVEVLDWLFHDGISVLHKDISEAGLTLMPFDKAESMADEALQFVASKNDRAVVQEAIAKFGWKTAPSLLLDVFAGTLHLHHLFLFAREHVNGWESITGMNLSAIEFELKRFTTTLFQARYACEHSGPCSDGNDLHSLLIYHCWDTCLTREVHSRIKGPIQNAVDKLLSQIRAFDQGTMTN